MRSSRPAASRSAARSAPPLADGRRRQPIDALRQLQSEFDRLIQDVEIGARSHAQVESIVDRGERIAGGIRAVVRGARSSNAR